MSTATARSNDTGASERTAGDGSKGVRVDVQRRVRTWAPPRSDLTVWATTALGRRAAGREIGVSVVGPAESRRLNARFRGRDKPTNVLSFPVAEIPVATVGEPRPLGDLVICPHVLRTEARAQKKSLRAHWAHLVVHGSLHLIGYDHERDTDAHRMERREVAVLRRLGFANPYRSP
ncbi:MAG: rRNA maturation RNase YbeY [Gammaproteobacteria bacterium]|nr:rRNA maturation RNase YbeY [Gammaproteobacteria bacterium]